MEPIIGCSYQNFQEPEPILIAKLLGSFSLAPKNLFLEYTALDVLISSCIEYPVI